MCVCVCVCVCACACVCLCVCVVSTGGLAVSTLGSKVVSSSPTSQVFFPSFYQLTALAHECLLGAHASWLYTRATGNWLYLYEAIHSASGLLLAFTPTAAVI